MIGVTVFVFGLIIGSFLNAVIYRLEKKESALHGRSYCPHCQHQLSWQDLIPIVSFFMLRGKCRYCSKSISWQYPVVEIATGSLFLQIFNFQFSIFNEFTIVQLFNFLYLLTIASLLIVLFVYDLKHYILPDKVIFAAIGVVVGYQFFVFFIRNWDLIKNLKLEIGNFETLANPLLAGVLAASFFFAIFLLSRGRAMGFGDVKLALLMGFLLGTPGIIVGLYVAFILGGLIGVFLIITKRRKLRSAIPFGPFLIIGTFVALVWSNQIINWYTSIISP